MSKFTVIGSSGFLGQEVVKQLINRDCIVEEINRNEIGYISDDLDYVIYCSGYGECDKDPYNVLDANSSVLSKLLMQKEFNKLIYISSTRVYMNSESSLEDSSIKISSDDGRKLFNLTKLIGEELCIKSKKNFTIVRPSNIYGVALNSPLFLPTITKNAIEDGKINMYVPKTYSKDYVHVKDVAYSVIELCLNRNSNGHIVNVASGVNVSASDIASILERETGCVTNWHDVEGFSENFPTTTISKLSNFIPNYCPNNVIDDLRDMIKEFKERL
ncbi:NAD-dependent epimerase/dehydratase family protein [Vibrio nigripulchritudo]|uniref:NAD-dependent epimerase/dehydratase family protein n=1 Tax=Vibrio nigripulchritudo TaxID=28173 RepID=UPI0005FA0A67|nr:SDR family oxidoreductase [Vibrio nigripulchritudo]KJY79061.1 dTDP-glucose 4,6-dehydratase [Vibrio nigripulchritudo]